MAENLVGIVADEVTTPKEEWGEKKEKKHRTLQEPPVLFEEEGGGKQTDLTLTDFNNLTHTQIWTSESSLSMWEQAFLSWSSLL